MANETWIPVTTTYIETRTQDERKYGVTAIIHCDEPLDIAICRRVPDNRPRPDWSQAPDWAQWWCVEPNEKVWWYEQEPTPFGYRWLIIGNPEPRRHSWGAIEIPLGVDWRELIEKRPEASDGQFD